MQTGTVISYILFVGKHAALRMSNRFLGEQIDEVACNSTKGSYCDNKSMFIWIAALVLVPLCCIRRINYLAYVSMFSLMATFFGCKCSELKRFSQYLSSWLSRYKKYSFQHLA